MKKFIKHFLRGGISLMILMICLLNYHYAHAGSAVLTIGSPTVAANGTTVTVPITGSSGSLSCPSNACTGFAVKVTLNGFTDAVNASTATASGTNITITLGTPVFTGDTVKVSLASGGSSNLTDGSGNTPSASSNTDIATTNSSTISGATAGNGSANLYFLGIFPPVTVGRYFDTVAQDSRIDFKCNHCTSMAFHGYNGSSYQVSVDGGSYNTLNAASDGSWNWTSGASGLSDVTHTFSIKNPSYIEANSSIRVSSSTGSSLTSISTYGNTSYPFSSTTFTNSGIVEGGPIANLSYRSVPTWVSSDAGIRFTSDCANISFWGREYSANFVVYRDGNYFSTYTTSSSLVYNELPIITGSDGAMHTWEVFNISQIFTGDNGALLYSMMGTGCTANSGTGFGTKPATRPFIVWNGDSIIDESNFISDMRNGDAFKASRAVGAIDQHIGNNGSTVASIISHLSDAGGFNNLSAFPSIVVLGGGDNDLLTRVGTSTTQANVQTWITNIASKLSAGSKILVRNLLDTTFTPQVISDRDSYKAAILAGVNAYNAGSPAIPAIIFNTDSWIIPASDTGDALHPNSTGFSKIANREIPILNSYVNSSSSFLVTAPSPSSGLNGQASADFTITLPGGAYFTGDQTITLSDGGQGGTFTPSNGLASGVSPLTVTPTVNLTSFTFKYTPASIGTKTISFTNGQDAWVNPSSVTYTVTSVPGAPTIGTATVSGSNVTVTFSVPGSNGGSAITGYTVTTYISGVSQGTTFDSNINSTSTTHTMTGLATNGTQYTFTVHATNGNGDSAESSATSPAVSLATVPLAPVSVTATAGDTQATVSFASGGNGGSTILGYTVTTYINGVSQGTTFDSNADTTSLTHNITGLTNGTTYTFKVSARNIVGTGSLSSASNSATPFHIPSGGGGLGGASSGGTSSASSIVNNTPLNLPPTTSTPTTTISTTPATLPPPQSSIPYEPIQKPSITYDIGSSVLKQGVTNNNAKELQKFLNNVLDKKLNVDGVIGKQTVLLIKQWQKENGLIPDGVVGPKTKAKMNTSNSTKNGVLIKVK